VQNVYDVLAGNYDSTTFATVSSFKGLENDYIILTEVEDLNDDWWRSVIYVGMSRARAGLCLFLPSRLKPAYQACIRDYLQKTIS
jgi:hypothetical protein